MALIDKLSGRPVVLSSIPGIPIDVVEALAAVDVTTMQNLLCHLHLSDLSSKTKISLPVLDEVVKAACEYFQSIPEYFDIKKKPIFYLSTGLQNLDRVLSGGISCGQVVEILGKSCTGKTQLCLKICALTARLGYGVIYVSSDKSLRGRIVEILRVYGCDDRELRKVMEKIAFAHVLSTAECVALLEDVLADVSAMTWYPERIDPGNGMGPAAAKGLIRCLGLVIVDSLSGILKPEMGMDSGMRDMNALRRSLRRIAEEASCAVLTVNTLTDSKEDGLKPSLGKSWLGIADTRIILEPRHSVPLKTLSSYRASNRIPSESTLQNLELKATVLSKCFADITSFDVSVGKGGLVDDS